MVLYTGGWCYSAVGIHTSFVYILQNVMLRNNDEKSLFFIIKNNNDSGERWFKHRKLTS